MLPPAKRFKLENRYRDKTTSVVNQNGIKKHGASEGSVLLREPQVVLTRLEDCTGNEGDGEGEMRTEEEHTAEIRTEEETTAEIRTEEEPTSEMRTEEETTAEIRTEEEPMDTGETVNQEAAKPPEDSDRELSEVLNSSGNVDVAYQVKELEKVLSSDTKCHESALKDENCDHSQSVSLCEEVTVEESVTSQDMITEVTELQEDHQVYIETAEGLVRQSAKELASKGIVIVNGPDGSTVHIEAPEGVPLETVHALLGIETGRNT